jgi:hypothetical protein
MGTGESLYNGDLLPFVVVGIYQYQENTNVLCGKMVKMFVHWTRCAPIVYDFREQCSQLQLASSVSTGFLQKVESVCSPFSGAKFHI